MNESQTYIKWKKLWEMYMKFWSNKTWDLMLILRLGIS